MIFRWDRIPSPKLSSKLAVMEPSLYRYIWQYTYKGQILLIILSVLSFPIIYITLELPKRIIDMLEGAFVPTDLFSISFNFGDALAFNHSFGSSFSTVHFLLFFSFSFLLAVVLNGGIKYFINVYRGSLGEQLLRRFRYTLFERVLRFPIPHFKRVSQGELIPMITTETEQLAEFIGESYTLPVYQGGMLLTYVYFIFAQDSFLGLAAIALYPFQLYVIPKLQKRVNALSKDRVYAVRGLSGRIGESISGISDVRINDTSQYERAHISHYLGLIYNIRYNIYRRKFFIKFLNNFIAQLTPFLFYSVGGYFVLRGELSIGAMVAVLVAYKDLSGPWKELLRYYQRKEDMKVKYTQVIEQFSPENLIDQAAIDGVSASGDVDGFELAAQGIGYSEDGLLFSVDGLSVNIPEGQHIAVLGMSNSGKDELARLMSRLVIPTSGVIKLGQQNMSDVSQRFIAKRMAYLGQNKHLFNGTLYANLIYPLQRRPVDTDSNTEQSKQRQEERQLAQKSGNTPYSVNDSWVDYRDFGADSEEAFKINIQRILDCVDLSDDVYHFGLHAQVSQMENFDLAQRIMKARQKLRDSLKEQQYAQLVEPFDQHRYNSNMSVGENLLFGTVYDDSIDSEHLADNPVIRHILDNCGLTEPLTVAGQRIAETMIDLFSDVEPDSELFQQFSFIDSEDLPEYQRILARTKGDDIHDFSADDQSRLLSLPLKLVVVRHRLGLIDANMQQQILDARQRIRDYAQHHSIGIEFFDESQYNPRISIQDNILFGKLAYGQANAQARINVLIADIIDELSLREGIVDAGLDYKVGVGGTRLSVIQRQKLGLACCLVKLPDVLIINDALSVLDTTVERKLIAQVRAYLGSQRSLLWVLSRMPLADNFERILLLDRGKLNSDGGFEELSENSELMRSLLST